MCVCYTSLIILICPIRMIEEGSRRGKTMAERRQIFMDMGELPDHDL